jgi:adenosylmethionine-8-amino-7-oxononanoate aminotransferase
MSITQSATSAEELGRLANDHLWLHFTRMGDRNPPIIVRGDGCYLEDANGKRYLDALAGLFSVNLGYGYGEEMGQAALEQMRELPFYTNWSYAHPRAIELAAELASLAPGDLNRVFFVNGGSEAVESAWKLARQYYLARGEKRIRDLVTPGARAGAQEAETMHDAMVAGLGRPAPRRYKAIARHIAYHGTTFGALSINGIPAIKAPFEPLVPEVRHVHNTNRFHRPPEETEAEFTEFLLDDLEQTILSMGPETVCLVHMEPIQNAGGSFVAPEGYWRGVREICDRYDILLSADEVITAFGRVGHWFASERYDIRPDIVTCAKGLSSSYAAIGAVIATDRVMEPFLHDSSMYSHGITFGGHPVMSAIALKNIEIMKRERINEHVLANEDAFRNTLGQLLDLPIVGDLRGTGFFYALELVKDKETRETFSDEECETLLRGFLSPRLFEKGLICRADDRGDPVVQISPPLVATQSEFDEMTGILGDVLTEAWEQVG